MTPGLVPCQRIAWLQRHVGIGGLFLFATTWRLWIPSGEFPQVPLVHVAGSTPVWLQWVLAAAAPIALISSSIVPRTASWSRRALLTFVVAYLGLILIDQQRLQPWAYQMAIMAIVLATANRCQAKTLLRIFVVSIYVYSGTAKLDHTFLQTVGSQFLDQLAQILHLPVGTLTNPQKAGIAMAFPLTELAIALCLAVPRLRSVGLIISIVMHAVLLLVVGPFGLHHKPAVLLWNVFFMVQNLLLFVQNSTAHSNADVVEATKMHPNSRRAAIVVTVAVLWPLTEPLGLCDHWLAWGLYAPRASRVSLFVSDAAADSLPEDLQPYLEPDNDSNWRALYLDGWSLAARDVPIYPQARVQLGVAEGVISSNSIDRAFRLVRFGPANRVTGEREHEILRTPQEIERAVQQYILNARPTLPLRLAR